MLSRNIALFLSVRKSVAVCEQFGKFLWCKKDFKLSLQPLMNSGRFMTIRPFILTSCAFPRVQSIKSLPLSKQDVPSSMMLNIAKRMQKQRNRKKDKLKKKLDEHMAADNLEVAVKEAVEMTRKKLRLDESAIVQINMNIDYLISEGMPAEIISKIASKSPKSLIIDLALIKKRIRVLKVNSIYEESIRKMFNKNPSLLLCKLEDTLSQKVEAIRGLQLNLSVLEIAKILERCPDVVEYLTVNNLVEKIEFMNKKVGFTLSQIRRIIIKNPAVLTMKKDSLKEKTDFCVNNFNLSHDQLSKYPRFFQCPINRLKERYSFLKQEELVGEDVKIRGWAFKNLAANSDDYFAEKIAQKPLKKFRDFQERRQREQDRADA